MCRHLIQLLFLCSFLIWGCSSQKKINLFQEWASEEEKLKVLSTTAMIDDIVAQIGGDRIVHLPLIVGEMDPHSYELVKGDDEKLSLAQLIFYNGLGLEHGASLRYRLETSSQAVGLGNAVLKSTPERFIRKGLEIDPHFWMDISLFAEIVDPIVSALTEKDLEGKEYYAANGRSLKEEMLKTHAAILDALHQIPEQRRYLVTSHDAFNYFARSYLATEQEILDNRWEARFDAPEGLSPDGQLSAANIRSVVDHLIAYQIHTVFPESNVSRDSLNKIIQVCAQKKLKVAISEEILYGDAMGPPGSDADTYLKMIGHDAAILIQTWGSSHEDR